MELEKVNDRLGIYIFYDKDGIVDDYVMYFLNDLKTVVRDLIVIVNGELAEESRNKLKSITEEVVIRENVGYEMKAYEYVFLDYLTIERQKSYSEIVMCNNSFYGPFIPLKKIFSEMETAEADYWGMGITDWGYFKVLPSFFVVYRSNIIQTDFLYDYFNKYKEYDITGFFDVVALFEYGLCGALNAKGFKRAVYASYDLRWILEYPDIYACDLGFPMLKRKVAERGTLARLERTLEYIKSNVPQWTNPISNNLKRQYGTDYKSSMPKEDKVDFYKPIITMDTIIDFVKKHKDIYIYGAGVLGRKVYMAYREYFINFKGFIVSQKDINVPALWGHEIYEAGEIQEGSAIIIALSRNNTREVYEALKGKNNSYLYINVY